jgi:hypothetical protein
MGLTSCVLGSRWHPERLRRPGSTSGARVPARRQAGAAVSAERMPPNPMKQATCARPKGTNETNLEAYGTRSVAGPLLARRLRPGPRRLLLLLHRQPLRRRLPLRRGPRRLLWYRSAP